VSGIAYYATTDANKNITEYLDASGNIKAHYEFSPFGKVVTATGAMSSAFNYRFSSEYLDVETGLVYYNFRFYSPELGKWISRDPIEERSGYNMYTFCRNNSISNIDARGLSTDKPKCRCCCVKDLTIRDIVESSKIFLGSSFDVDFNLEYKDDPKNSNDCKLKWQEKTNRPYPVDHDKTMKPNEPNEMTEIFTESPTFKNWFKRPNKDSHIIVNERDYGVYPEGVIDSMHDDAQVSVITTESRKLEIKITIESGEGCQCGQPSLTKYLIQNIDVDQNGKKTSTLKEVDKDKLSF